jgi:hypothetical protein
MGGVYNLVNLHVYHYAGNNPVKYTDPDGNAINFLAGALVGMVVSGVIDVAFQLGENGGDISKIDGARLAGALVGGAVAGAITSGVLQLQALLQVWWQKVLLLLQELLLVLSAMELAQLHKIHSMAM